MNENEQLKARIEQLETWRQNMSDPRFIPYENDVAFRERFGNGILKTSAWIDFGSIASGANATQNVNLDGVKVNDPVLVSGANAVGTGVFFTGSVQVAGIVTVRCDNYSASSKDPSNSEYNIIVFT